METHAARQDTRIRTRVRVGRGLGMVWAAAFLAGALPIAEVTSSALAQAPAITHLAGAVSSDDPGVFLVDGVRIAVADTAIATETSLGGYKLDVPSGPHTLVSRQPAFSPSPSRSTPKERPSSSRSRSLGSFRRTLPYTTGAIRSVRRPPPVSRRRFTTGQQGLADPCGNDLADVAGDVRRARVSKVLT